MRSHLLSWVALSLTASAVILLPPATAGDLYKWTDDKGRVHYTSTPPPDTAKKAKTLDAKALSKINALSSDPNADRASMDSSSDDSDASTPATPAKTASGNAQETAPASPPALIPASLLPASNPPTMAQSEPTAQPEIIEVVAQGMGINANAALLNAYSNAVQQALGLYVDAETLVQNDEIVRDKILTYSKGFIQEATTVKESQANGLFQVSIRAKVKRQQLLEQAKTNKISVKAVEGVSLHAKVMSQIKQEQDANALLKKALLPFAGTDLMRAELTGEPKILEQEQGNITLSYPVHLFIDDNEHKKATNELIAILNTISSEKKELTMQNKNLERDKFNEDVNFEDIREIRNKKSSCIKMLTWKDKQFTHSKWLIYSLPSNLNLKQLAQEINRPEIISTSTESNYAIAIELSLLAKDEEIIAMGSISPDFFYLTRKYSFFTKDLSTIKYQDNCYIIRPYFSNENYNGISYSKIPIDITIKIAQQDLPNVKTAKLEVKRGN